MPGKLVAIGGARLVDLHSQLDEAIAGGAVGGILVTMNKDGSWAAQGTDGMTAAERAFIYQQLIILEVAWQGDDDE